MLYIHEMNQLSPRAADIESVAIIRDIKKTTPYPFSVEQLKSYFEPLFISQLELSHMEQGVPVVAAAITEIDEMLKNRDFHYEPINLQRAATMLNEVPAALANNIAYAQQLYDWQNVAIQELADLLNNIPHLETTEDKNRANDHLKKIFNDILRSSEFEFNDSDIINEGQKTRIKDLLESMEQGFFFHVSIENQLKKVPFSVLRRSIPTEKLAKVDALKENIAIIKKSVDAAYTINMRMTEWAVILYSYTKWLTSAPLNR